MVTRGLSLGVKRLGREADHSPPYSTEINIAWSYTSTPPFLHGKFYLCLFFTSFPTQWVPGALSLRVKRPGREADHSPPSSAEAKECMELYLHSLNTSSWRGA